jgi:PAS domain S-box-containing protein
MNGAAPAGPEVPLEEYRRQQLEMVADHAALALLVLDEQQHCTYMNPAAEQLTGVTLEDASAGPLHRLLHHTRPDGSPCDPVDCPLARACPGPERVEGEEVLVRPDGAFYPVAYTATPVRQDGSVVGTVLELRPLGAAPRPAGPPGTNGSQLVRSRLAAAFEQAPAFIATLRGPEHTFELANPACLQLIGDRPIVGHPAAEVLPETVEQGFIELLDRVYESGDAHSGWQAPLRLRREPDAALAEVFVDYVLAPVRGDDGAVAGIVFHGVDVTDLVVARRQLEETQVELEAANQELQRTNAELLDGRRQAEFARDEAERASRVKSEFLAMMSHELRTPLNAMIGYSDLLLGGVPDPIPRGARSKVERIAVSARHLLQLIDEILTYSQLEAGEERVNVGVVPCNVVLDELRALMEPLAHIRELRLDIATAPAELVLESDARKVRQILLNLLGNAVKFTPEGAVSMRVEARAADVIFVVEDTGIGIAPEHHELVFSSFWQVDGGATRAHQGTGLGLAVARRLARLLGGDVTLESELGRGSTFRVRLPRRAPQAVPRGAAQAVPRAAPHAVPRRTPQAGDR